MPNALPDAKSLFPESWLWTLVRDGSPRESTSRVVATQSKVRLRSSLALLIKLFHNTRFDENVFQSTRFDKAQVGSGTTFGVGRTL